MVNIGEIQKLKIKRIRSVGAFLNNKDNGQNKNDVLLPSKEVPAGVSVGDFVEVFIYRDSGDRLIATTRRPKILLGEIAPLEVVDITGIGAFLDWGLEKDLFLPFKEQTTKLQKGIKYLIALYIDKSDRLCGTMRIKDPEDGSGLQN